MEELIVDTYRALVSVIRFL